MIGKTLAHYEITAAIGKGGMGEVYQATDTKLGRSVAIKVLPEEFASDTDRVARFEREAKLLASLNHPNIAAIYGLEESEGTRFLVLELVDGQTLSERLVRGRLLVQESLELAFQIAEALDAAHEKGIIHRDLKPANIKVTPDGKVKVLDFGLAKAYAGTSVGDETVLETLAEDAENGRGVLLGTPAYMSPEQARRQPADHRSDVWAFGCVLYELLDGRTLFKGNTLSDTIAAVLDRELDFGKLPRINPGLRRLLKRCLEKNPKRRWQAIGDVGLEIEEILAHPEGTSAQPLPQRRLLPYAATIALAIVAGAVGTWYLKPLPPPESRPVTRFHYELPEEQAFGAGTEFPLITISPDGTRIAYVANSQLHLWDQNSGVVTPIAGTTGDNPQDPFFSPDGQWIAYFARATSELKKISVGGGTPVLLSEVSRYLMGSWINVDAIVYGDRNGILKVPASGGTPELLIPAVSGELLALPQMLPDGEAVLFAVLRIGSGQFNTVVQSVGSSERTVLIEDGIDVRYLPTGHLVYGVGSDLLAVPFDVDDRELRGSPVPVMSGVFTNYSLNATFSAAGTLAYLPGGSLGEGSSVRWVSRDGEITTLPTGSRRHRFAVSSRDGSRVAALVDGQGGVDIWLYDVESGTPVQLTNKDRPIRGLAWSADGERIAYSIDEQIYWQKADGSESPRLLWEHEQPLASMNWSADGRFLAFDTIGDTGTIWVFSLDDATATPFVETNSQKVGGPSFSPDGRWISYVRRGNDGPELWVAPFPGPGAARLVYTANGAQGGWNTWSRDGKQLYFRGAGPDFYQMMAVPIETEPDFTRGEPQTLFELPVDFAVYGFDPARERFLIISGETGNLANPPRINVVQNWFQELKEKVPVP